MKKLLRILAILGSILLIGLYFITLILAITLVLACLDKNFFPMFMAALFASMALPILLWIYSFIYKLTKKDSQQN